MTIGAFLLGAVAASISKAPPVTSFMALPLTYDEQDAANSMTWVRQGPGPHVTPSGFEGDGYEARYKSTTIPSWMGAADAEVVLHLSAKAYQNKLKSTTRETLAYIGEDTSTANPKLELALGVDPSDTSLSAFAVRAYTSAVQTAWLGRPEWRYEFRFPELYSGASQARPQGLLFLDSDTVMVSAHYQDTESRVYKVRISDGAVLGSFSFGTTTYRHVSTFAKRSNGDVWATDYETRKMLRLDLDASFSSGSAVILNVYDTSILDGMGAIEFVTVSGTEYALIGQYATSGTPYVYAVLASKLGTGTFALADRHKRFVLGLRIQGYAMNAGKLFVSRNIAQGLTTDGGYIQRYDIATAITSSADGATLTAEATFNGPSRFVEDVKFHPTTGHIWMPTEGVSAVGSDEGSLGVWSSPLTGQPVENHYTIHYDGGSAVTIKVNNRLFAVENWALTRPVQVVSVGGPPQAAAGMQTGFFAGYVRNLVVQDAAMTDAEYALAVSGGHETGTLTSYTMALTNSGAELGNTTGWTNEVGSLGVRNASPAPAAGSWYFFGGPNLQTICRQRLDVLTQTGLTGAQVDAGNIWAKARWKQTSFDSLNDPGACGLRTLNASSAQIAQQVAGVAYTPNSISTGPWYWYNRCLPIDLASGTRYLDALMRYDRTAGTNNDTYIDDVEVVVYRRA